MFKTFRFIAQVAAVAAPLALGNAPAVAQDIVINGTPSFRDLEYDYSGADRIEAARTAFQTLIPAGTPIADARATLRKAGAHCPPVAGTGDLSCAYHSFAAREEQLQDINWKIQVRSEDGRATGVEVDRTTLGS